MKQPLGHRVVIFVEYQREVTENELIPFYTIRVEMMTLYGWRA